MPKRCTFADMKKQQKMKAKSVRKGSVFVFGYVWKQNHLYGQGGEA